MPIEITPDNTIITGHQRVAAAKKLGWTTIKARVRHDLVAEGEAAVTDRLIRDNLDRRQLSALDQIRCYQALKENAKKLPREKRVGAAKGDLRDELAKRFSVSGRSLDRQLRLLKTPIEVQNAFAQKKITMTLAGRVAGAKPEIQKKIAKEIQAGTDPKSVVEKHVPKSVQKKVDDSAALNTFLRRLTKDIADLKSRQGLYRPMSKVQRAILSEGIEVMRNLLANCPEKKSIIEEERARYLAKIGITADLAKSETELAKAG